MLRLPGRHGSERVRSFGRTARRSSGRGHSRQKWVDRTGPARVPRREAREVQAARAIHLLQRAAAAPRHRQDRSPRIESAVRTLKIDRRTLLIGGGAGVGLVVAFLVWPRHPGSDLTVGAHESAFGNFIKIARDGRITVAVPQTETGQGIWTALPQVVADELGAAWETIAVEPAPLTSAYANPLAREEGWLDGFGFLREYEVERTALMRMTASATSIRAFETPLREAAAVAREMLVGAAADRWNVSPDEGETGDGFVLNRGRTFTFGELAEEASDRAAPSHPQPRRSAKGRLLGQPLERLDGPGKADGSWRFAADVRLPGMLFASVRIAPPGGALRSYSREAISNEPGIRHITAREEWMAVVGETWSAAERAMQAADPVFSGTRSSVEWRGAFEDAL